MEALSFFEAIAEMFFATEANGWAKCNLGQSTSEEFEFFTPTFRRWYD